jgi:flagellin
MTGETFEEGDIITLAIEGKQAQYTVSADDMAGDSAGADFQNILDSIAADTDIAAALGVTIAATAATGLTFTSDDASDFDVDASYASGALGFIAASDVDTRNNANRSIAAIDSALGAVNDQRANMGAVINRLQYTVNNLTNISTHSAEARSRIEDTNYAQATMDLAKSQIIQQAATAMLAQANQQPQQVLTLLK